MAYATPVKHSRSSVSTPTCWPRTGPVHPDVALQMADGVRRVVAVDGRPADVGISTTGIAGPDSPDGQPVGTVHIGSSRRTWRSRRSLAVLEGDRAEIRAPSVEAALSALLEVLGNS